MKFHYLVRILLLAASMVLASCSSDPVRSGAVTLLDGEKGMENFNVLGDANWRAEGGAVVADKGKSGYLVSKKIYKDFLISAEFWAETDTNSGIFIRASDPKKIG
ncbi:family 16 glycoside hydrolase, partial [Zwartia sp.]|uniref:family 16 glycoside hydrolase n=1 Tax=Zwartia sp. TaxID=2978004 RepID=UPI002725A41A